MNYANQRRHIRARPDATDYVQIDKNPDNANFNLDAVALLVEEAPMGGFGVVCLKSVGLEKGVVYRFKVGRMAALKAEVVWTKELDEDIIRAGLRFLE